MVIGSRIIYTVKDIHFSFRRLYKFCKKKKNNLENLTIMRDVAPPKLIELNKIIGNVRLSCPLTTLGYWLRIFVLLNFLYKVVGVI